MNEPGDKEIYGCLCKGSDVMSLKIRGINYDTSIDFHSDGLSREIWNEDDIRRDMMAIRTEPTGYFLCPEGNGLSLKRLQRNEYGIYREYRAEKSDCQSCPSKANA